jgi:hypothetical protein
VGARSSSSGESQPTDQRRITRNEQAPGALRRRRGPGKVPQGTGKRRGPHVGVHLRQEVERKGESWTGGEASVRGRRASSCPTGLGSSRGTGGTGWIARTGTRKSGSSCRMPRGYLQVEHRGQGQGYYKCF